LLEDYVADQGEQVDGQVRQDVLADERERTAECPLKFFPIEQFAHRD
jgi:hypothetical protein